MTSPFSPAGQNGRPQWTLLPTIFDVWAQFPTVGPAYDEVGYDQGGYGQDGYDTPSSPRQGIPQPQWTLEVVR